MKYFLAAICLACIIGCEARVRVSSEPTKPEGNTITGVLEKIEWLEDGLDGAHHHVVILFKDGRHIKLMVNWCDEPIIFHYGKDHTFIYSDWGRILDVEVSDDTESSMSGIKIGYDEQMSTITHPIGLEHK